MRRPQSRNRKTMANVSKTLLQTKKMADKKISQPLCQKINKDVFSEKILQLDTCQETCSKQIDPTAIPNLFQEQIRQSDVVGEEDFMMIDPAIMEQIQKEIYESEIVTNVSPIDKLKKFSIQHTDSQNKIDSSGKVQEEIKETNNSKQEESIGQKERDGQGEAQGKFKKTISEQIQKIHLESDQDSIVVPQKSIVTQTTLTQNPQSTGKSTNKKVSKTNPQKKLKTNTQNRNLKYLNLTIDLKLLRSNIKVKKIIKCLDSNDIYDRWKAKFLVETQGGDRQILSNEEMVCFYKEVLIDYYQGIHFS